ncbi:MAG TPA: hypothetical protein VEA38_00940 [Terriglobales bacterium]|nr:hypothetical protein [Terriglobales bacterium]
MTTFAFVITLLVPVFGAEIEVPVRAKADTELTARDACWKARRAAQEMLRGMGVRARVTACEVVP